MFVMNSVRLRWPGINTLPSVPLTAGSIHRLASSAPYARSMAAGARYHGPWVADAMTPFSSSSRSRAAASTIQRNWSSSRYMTFVRFVSRKKTKTCRG